MANQTYLQDPHKAKYAAERLIFFSLRLIKHKAYVQIKYCTAVYDPVILNCKIISTKSISGNKIFYDRNWHHAGE